MDCLTPWDLVHHFIQSQPQCVDVYGAAPPSDSIGLTEYLPFLLKTLILELPMYYLLLKKVKSFKEVLIINLFVNLATHPIIFIAMPPLLNAFHFSYLSYLLIAEIFAPVVEALIINKYYKVNAGRAWAASIIANLVSWSIGVYWM
ncbi:MAG: hypothetical protein ACXVAX_01235 [Pseudobdellovibrio sp.]